MAESPPRRQPSPVAITAVVLVGVAVALALLVAGTVSDSGRDAATVSADGALADPALGDEDAPVEVVEYSDFRCPYCAQFARDTKPELVERFVDTGVVRYVWRDLPYQGEGARRAALAARAAQEQGRFWEYHDALFANQEQEPSLENLRAVADDLDLDVDRFDEALQSERHADVVAAGFEEGQELGLTGTPAFTINGEILIGAQPLEVFVDAIEAAAGS